MISWKAKARKHGSLRSCLAASLLLLLLMMMMMIHDINQEL